MEKTKIVIADDHPIVRAGLVKLIEQSNEFEVIAQCGDGEEALQYIREHKPDLAILDITMPKLNGLEIVKKSRTEKLPVEFIILTMYDDEEYFEEAMDNDVLGYLLKDNAVDELHDCLRAVAKGKHYICPQISKYLIDRNSKMQFLLRKAPQLDNLTSTEKSILKLIGDYKSSKEIAEELFISVRTVDNHRYNITQKLELKGRNKLLEFAVKNKSLL
ncbi:MAG: response regulator transcription factor [Calditrichia bacterium]|nr:response regulator transcription factor [Calditrichia bacterium]